MRNLLFIAAAALFLVLGLLIERPISASYARPLKPLQPPSAAALDAALGVADRSASLEKRI